MQRSRWQGWALIGLGSILFLYDLLLTEGANRSDVAAIGGAASSLITCGVVLANPRRKPCTPCYRHGNPKSWLALAIGIAAGFAFLAGVYRGLWLG